MSMMTTSASSLSATARATVAPTFPAPPTTVTFRFMRPLWLSATDTHRRTRLLHVGDDAAAERRALHLVGALHQPCKIIGDGPGGNRPVHALHHQVGGFGPSHVAQHHFAREDDRARVDLVLVGVLGRRAVGGLEDGVAGHVIDVAPRGGPDP